MANVDASLRPVPHRVTDPQRIPAKRYYDEEFFKLECERVWPHVWQMACRLEQIPNIGDWVEYSNLGKSVIVVRTSSGVKAFHNTCRHRGVQLASGHGNCRLQGFVCPFHGWAYNIDGKNTFVYGRQLFDKEILDPTELALRPCRLEVQLGCVFINFDEHAPSFRDSIGPLVDRLEAHNVSELRAEWWLATVLPANWKTAMEAFMEGMHVMRTHPQLQQALPSLFNRMYAGVHSVSSNTDAVGGSADPAMSSRDNIEALLELMELLNVGMAGQCQAKEIEIARKVFDGAELPDDPNHAVMTWYGMMQDQITKQLRARGEPVPDLNAVSVSHPVQGVEFMFPHYFLLPYLTSMASYRVRPLGPESCLFELWSLTFYPEGQEPKPPMEPVMLPHDSEQFPPIPRQDYSNIPLQQLGLHGGGFDYMRLSNKGEGLISNYQRLIDGYIAGVPPEKLAKANHLLGGNFDGPIKDLGF
jgi:carnitine monooxygenase subunit